MLSRFDDYPIHQTSEPIAHPATSDRNVYDRYWFNGYQDDGAFYFGIGAALYPNLGIMDCGLSLVIDGEQHAFHASRRAPTEPTDITVGPFKLEIQEPMKRLRVTLDDNETGIAGELQWIPRTASIEEGHQLLRLMVWRSPNVGSTSGGVRSGVGLPDRASGVSSEIYERIDSIWVHTSASLSHVPVIISALMRSNRAVAVIEITDGTRGI